ncbi:hypothetical protein KUV57_13320 [Epibacterium sp. DP7N7-1]|nr:hypothetical protein [Epibacterium sp. DP7N7-1]
MAHEFDIRSAEFSIAETRVVENGEVDVFLASELEDVEIQVLLTFDTDRATSKQVTFEAVRFADQNGHPLHIINEEGTTMDSESCQVMALEILEDDIEISIGYAYGRDRIRRKDGSAASIGDVIHHQQETPSFSI